MLETYSSSSRGPIFDMVNLEYLDKVMQMVTIPGNLETLVIHAARSIDTLVRAGIVCVDLHLSDTLFWGKHMQYTFTVILIPHWII